MKSYKKKINPHIVTELEADFLQRSLPAGYAYLVLMLFLFSMMRGSTYYLALIVVILNIFRIIVCRKVNNNRELLNSKLPMIHKVIVVINAAVNGVILSQLLWYADSGSIITVTLIILDFAIVLSGVAALAANLRVLSFVVFCGSFIPATAVTFKIYALKLPTQEYYIGLTLYLCFFYAIIQTFKFHRQLVKRFEYESIIREEREYLQVLIDSIPGFIINLDSSLQITSISRDIIQYFGDTFKLGESIVHIKHPLVDFIKNFIHGSQTSIAEEIELPVSGKNSWFLLSLFKSDKSSHNLIVTGVPINELINARKELEEQTIKAMNSSKLASLGEMAAGVGHEVNNPIAIIHGYATEIKLLVQKNAPEKEKAILEKVENIAKASLRVKKIVSSLRLLSREAGEDPFENTELAPIIEDTLGLCQQKFIETSINLEVKSLADVRIMCRPTQVSQVLLNVINNAYDAVIDSTEKTVSISFEKSAESIKILVQDSGHGIPDEIKEKIYEPFFTTKKVGRGTGLGLSISKSIMQEHHGKIYSTKIRNNTCFIIEFPLAVESRMIVS